MNRPKKVTFSQRGGGFNVQKLCWIALVFTYGAVIVYFITNSTQSTTTATTSASERSLRIPDVVYSRALPPLVVPIEPFLGSTQPPEAPKEVPQQVESAKIAPLIVPPTPNIEISQPKAASAPLKIDSSHIVPTDGINIAAELLTLAKLPSAELKVALNKTGHDVFHLMVTIMLCSTHCVIRLVKSCACLLFLSLINNGYFLGS
jgi:hypothetical protein